MQILLVGHGKMGRMVESLAGEYGCVVAGVIDPQSPTGQDGPDAERWRGVDVAIDFSSPDAVVTSKTCACPASFISQSCAAPTPTRGSWESMRRGR